MEPSSETAIFSKRKLATRACELKALSRVTDEWKSAWDLNTSERDLMRLSKIGVIECKNEFVYIDLYRKRLNRVFRRIQQPQEETVCTTEF